ncbi:MAG: hypothetical protein AAF357_03520 [Verrucomicrobiota bacterium]
MKSQEVLPNTAATPAKCGWLVISKGAVSESGMRSFAGTTGLEINHQWKRTALTAPRGFAPNIFATVQGFGGPDPVSIRFRNFGDQGIDFRLQEEASKDPELVHVKEEVGFLILGDVRPRDILTSGLEVSEVETGHGWARVDFASERRHPVVIPGILGFNGPDAAIPRISQVTRDGFKVQVAEWDYLDGGHARETIPYLVIEDGVYSVGSGIWEAGRTLVDGKGWKKVQFRSTQFGVQPLVMVGQTTVKDTSKVTIRLRNVTSSGFEARLYRQESDKLIKHGSETVHFLAVDQATGNIAGAADFRTWSRDDATNLWKEMSLPVFSELPFVFGSTQTSNGIDPIGVRSRNSTVSSFEFKLQEETSADPERHHIPERIGGIALGVFSPGDSDGDGLTDAEEAFGQEVVYQVQVEVPVLDPVTGEETGETETVPQTHLDWVYTDPNSADSDGDGLPDKFEFDYGLNPTYRADGDWDSDGDGISDGDEYLAGTHELSWFPDAPDNGGADTGGGDSSSDGGDSGDSTDGGSDSGEQTPPVEIVRPFVDPQRAWLIRHGLDPDESSTLSGHSDGDTLTNAEEYALGLNPLMADSDMDGYTDSEEIASGTDPLDGSNYISGLSVEEDGDRDGMLDSWEVLHGLDPTDERDAVRDFDYDRLPSILEYQLGTDPMVGAADVLLSAVNGRLRELELPTHTRVPNYATATFNDMGEWYSLGENDLENVVVNRWSESRGFEEIGQMGDSNILLVQSIEVNNLGMVAAWVMTNLHEYELRVMSPDGNLDVVLSGTHSELTPHERLKVTDSGFVVGAYRDSSNDGTAFRWRSGILETASLSGGADDFLDASEAGEVLSESDGVVIPYGREAVGIGGNEFYRAISKFGEIDSFTWDSTLPYGYWSSARELSRAYFRNTQGDSFSFFDVNLGFGTDISWLVRPGAYESYRIADDQWMLDGRGAFDYSRDPHSLLFDPDNLSSYGESEDYSYWDGSYLGVFDSSYVFPERDAALVSIDFNEYRDVVGFITFDSEESYSDGSIGVVETGFLFQYPLRDFQQGATRFWRINNAGDIISSRRYEEYWEHYDDETGEYYDGYLLKTDWHLRSPDNDQNGNRLPDDWESFWGVNAPEDDYDGDGLTDFQEYTFNTNPHLADSDGDGLRDDIEIQIGYDPRSEDPDALDSDLDGDGLPLWKELELGTNVHYHDSDQDGLSDREEWETIGTSPLVADHDGDGILDGVEVLEGSDPFSEGLKGQTYSCF